MLKTGVVFILQNVAKQCVIGWEIPEIFQSEITQLLLS